MNNIANRNRYNLVDPFFDDFFNDFPFYEDKDMKNVEKKLYGKKANRIMKTDIKDINVKLFT